MIKKQNELRVTCRLSQGSKCIYLVDSSGPDRAECRGFWEACQWTKELNLEKVEFELDSKIVIDAVTKAYFLAMYLYAE